MANQILIKRNTVANIGTLTAGELYLATDTLDLYIGSASGNKLVGGIAALLAKVSKAGDTMTGNLLFTDNTLDIGASGATRPRTGYFGTSVVTPLIIGTNIKPSADSTTAIQLQNAAGTNILNVDTTNGRVGIGTTSPTANLHVVAPAIASTNENIFKFGVSDAPNDFVQIRNKTGSDGYFVPEIYGFSTLTSRSSISFFAEGTDTAGGVAILNFEARPPGGGAITNRPIAVFDTNKIASMLVWDTAVNIGNVGNYQDAPVPTKPTSTLTVKGYGATSATSSLNVTNSSDTSLLYVRNDGNVGIGTTSPGAKLHVSGGKILIDNDQTFSAKDNTGTIVNLVRLDSNNVVNFGDYQYTLNISASSGGTILAASSIVSPVVIQRTGNATAGDTTKDGNQLVFRGAYWNGSASTIVAPYIYNDVVDTTPTYQIAFNVNGDRMVINSSGYVGIGTTSPTAVLHLKAGTATASTAPFKLTTGVSNTTAELGAIEFTDPDIFFSLTDTTVKRKAFVLDDGTRLTATRVPFAGTNGRLVDDADMTFATDTLTVTKLVGSTSVKAGTAAGFISSDGSTGATGSFTTVDLKTVTVKDGIITSIV